MWVLEQSQKKQLYWLTPNWVLYHGINRDNKDTVATCRSGCQLNFQPARVAACKSILHRHHSHKPGYRSKPRLLCIIALAQTCTDKHRCCQSSNNGDRGETHLLYEVIWDPEEWIGWYLRMGEHYLTTIGWFCISSTRSPIARVRPLVPSCPITKENHHGNTHSCTELRVNEAEKGDKVGGDYWWKKTSAWTLSVSSLTPGHPRNDCLHIKNFFVISVTALIIKFSFMIIKSLHSRTKRFIIPSACRQLSQLASSVTSTIR